MTSPTKNEVTIYNPRKDRIEVLRFRKLKEPILPKLKVELVPQHYAGLDPDDKVRTPILKILMDKEHELDPRLDCVQGYRADCTLYDRLVKVSNAFLQTTSRSERDRVLTSPESAFLQGEPRFCRFCLMEEHQRRKRERKLLRRLVRWLSLNI